MKLKLSKFSLYFSPRSAEYEYRAVKEATMKNFFVFVLILLILVFAITFVAAIVQDLWTFILGYGLAILFCFGLIVYGFLIGRFTGFILTVICLTYYLYSIIQTHKYMIVPMANAIFYSGYSFAAFERIVVHELPRLEFKLLFGVICFTARFIWARPLGAGAIITQVIYYSTYFFVDVFREKKDRSIFKAFYDYREELIKFKNLMVSGLPVNILVLSKDMKKRLFSNEHFDTTFETRSLLDPSPIPWYPADWLSKLRVENNFSGDANSSSNSSNTNTSVDLQQHIQSLIERKLLSNEGQLFNLRTVTGEGSAAEEKIYMAKVFSLIWDRNIDAVAIVLNDITEQYANLSLKIANANKDKMIAMVSHELRTPLNGILGMLQIMEKEIKDEKLLTYFNICKNSGKLLLSIVNSILDLGQIRNNKLKLCVTKTDLSEILNEIYYMFEFQFKQKELYLETDINNEVSKYIYTDKNRLKQILINLVGNALKFTFHGGVKILVNQSFDQDGYLEFRVSDTGIGIKEEDKEKLFQLYGKLEQTDHKLNTEGVGLGLTISNFLVKLLSKEDEGIKVQSNIDEGTTLSFSIKAELEHEDVEEVKEDRNTHRRDQRLGTLERMGIDDDFHLETSLSFERQNDRGNISKKMTAYRLDTRVHMTSEAARFTSESLENVCLNQKQPSLENENSDPPMNLRLTKPEMEIISVKKSSSDSSGSEKKNVLLVDDSPFNIMVAKHLIESLGYRVKTALNGSLALKAVEEAMNENKVYNIILMDCQMPVMDGYEATKALRKMMATGEIPTIPILALSANDSDNDKKRSKNVGMVDHLTKPVNEIILKDALEKYCK